MVAAPKAVASNPAMKAVLKNFMMFLHCVFKVPLPILAQVAQAPSSMAGLCSGLSGIVKRQTF